MPVEFNSNIEYATNTNYSRLLWWEFINFMSIEHGLCEFDETNIINMKGYNDSGKSNALRALDVLMNDRYPTNQVNFIMDDKPYFDIRGGFDDGIMIRKIKYANGQGLYEMYRDKKLIFTTKQNGTFTRISGVPQIIADYLGMLSYKDIFLNSRSCFEKQLLVQTTGSENYKFLNAVLHSEEITQATEMLNVDKNKILAEKTKLEYELQILRNQVSGAEGVSIELVSALKVLDKKLDTNTDKLILLEQMRANRENSYSVSEVPALDLIDTSKLDLLLEMQKIVKEKNVAIPPQLNKIDTGKLGLLLEIYNVSSELSSIPRIPNLKPIDTDRLGLLREINAISTSIKTVNVPPKLEMIDLTRLKDLAELNKLLKSINACRDADAQDLSRLEELKAESDILAPKLKAFGYNVSKCSNCGTIVEV